MPYETPITIKQALERIHATEYVLPAIQREFVWGPDRITRLFDSLMRNYPIQTSSSGVPKMKPDLCTVGVRERGIARNEPFGDLDITR